MSRHAGSRFVKQIRRLKPRDRAELTLLIGGIAILLLLVVFMKLASEVFEGETQSFDRHILLALRDPADLSHPIGPSWMVSAALDITSLDSCSCRDCGGGRSSPWRQASAAGSSTAH
jgi:hypothetical protein